MADNAIIGALRVVLGADTAALEKGLKDAQSALGNFGAGFSKLAATTGAAMLAIGAGVAAGVKGVINEADKLNKLSQSIGIPVEELSKLKYAAELSDVSLKELGTSLGKLAKNLTEAAAKPTSEAANAFRALGVSTTDANGKLRSQNEVLLDVAQKFSGLKDGAGKTAVAIALFGRAGANMIPFLNQGRDGIKELTDRAAELGVVISAETAARAEKFNDTMKDIGAVFKGVITIVAAQILPTFQNLAKIFFDSAKNSDSLKVAADSLSFSLKSLVTAGVIVGATFKAVGEILSGVVAAIVLASQGEFKAAWEALKMGASDMATTIKGAAGVVGQVWSDAANNSVAATNNASKALKDFNYSAMGGKNAIDQFLDSLAKKKAGMEAELQTIGLNTAEQEKARIVLEGLAIAKAKHIPISDALIQRLDREGTGFGNLAEKLQDAKERFNTIKSSMEGVASKFEDALVSLADGSKTAKQAFSDMAKGILSDLLRLIIRLTITIPLAKQLVSLFGGGFTTGGSDFIGPLLPSSPSPTVAPSMMSMTGPENGPANSSISITILPGAKEDKATTKRGRRGETFIELHTKLTNAAMADGMLDGGMGGRFGARPVPVLR